MYKDGHYDYGVVGKDPHIRINASNLMEVRQKLINGEWPEACYNCKEAENNGVGSMRTIWNKTLEKFDIPLNESINPNDVKYLDLTFSTKCNSKCMTCSSSLSDFWESEWDAIWRIRPEQQLRPAHGNVVNRICIDSNTTRKIVNDFPNVEFISFVGGEPTISDEHTEFLKLLVENGRSSKIKISYVTNLTGITDELISLWKQFKAVHLSVSIDGYQRVNEYIRYPFKWTKIESNLRMLLSMMQESFPEDTMQPPTFTVGLSCTVSLFNAIQCMDLFEFWLKTALSYRKPNNDGTLAHMAGCFVNRVSHPQYSLVSLLSLKYRSAGIEKGKKILEFVDSYLKDHPDERIDFGFIESVKLVIKWLEEPQIINSTFLSQSKHFITESDSFRNRHLKYYIPELWEELESIWKAGIIPGDYYVPGLIMNTVKNELVDGSGYVVTDNIISNELINKVISKLPACYPVRASSRDKKYAERDDIKTLPDISVWWSQTVMDWPEVQEIAKIVGEQVKKYLPSAEFYASDIVTIDSGSTWFNPHVDTPHRFRKWNYNRNLLGVQVIVALHDMDRDSASTGIVPHSQKLDYDINLCYRGHYNEWFLKNVMQPTLPKGCVLLYNCRLLHSSMPNPLDWPRPALLLNYLDSSIIEEVTKIDNVWTSNGK
jgi:ectoine hydroxylase-related dioxygenase (phytanoyl-CoA dioxygenase family)